MSNGSVVGTGSDIDGLASVAEKTAVSPVGSELDDGLVTRDEKV